MSLFGLTAAVDDLSITYFVADGRLLRGRATGTVDLGGLAVSADIGPLSIAGGLLKNGSGDDIEYLGMLLGRFGVYGLTIYGGYGKERAATVTVLRRSARSSARSAACPRSSSPASAAGSASTGASSCRPTCRSSATTR